MDEVLWELIARLEVIAPQVWALAVRQVWVDAVRNGTLGVLGMTLVFRTLYWARIERGDGDKDTRWGIFALVAIFIGCVACVALYDVIGAILNPQWQAIHLLRNLIP